MSRLQEIFAYIKEMEGHQGSEESHAFVAEIQELFRIPEELAWLKDQIGSLPGQANFFLKVMSLDVKFPEELIMHIRECVAHTSPSYEHFSLATLLAFQGDPLGLEALENYLYLRKYVPPSIVVEVLMAFHSDSAKAVIERYCRDGSDPDALSDGQDYLKRWNDPGTHRCSLSFDGDWED
jgi:hypothetical protein